MRLTKEREQEIRDLWTHQPIETEVGDMVRELLSEIDALREELRSLKKCLLQMQHAVIALCDKAFPKNQDGTK